MACETAGRGDWPILLCLGGGALERDHRCPRERIHWLSHGLEMVSSQTQRNEVGFCMPGGENSASLETRWRYTHNEFSPKEAVTSCHYYCSWVFQSSLCKESFFLLTITLDFFFSWNKIYIVTGFGCSHLWYGFACLSHPSGPATVLCVPSKKEHAHFPNASYRGPCMVLGASHGLCQRPWAGGGEVGRRSWPYAWSMSQHFRSYVYPQQEGWCLSQKDTCENVYSRSICNSQNWKLPKYPSTGKWIDCSIQLER